MEVAHFPPPRSHPLGDIWHNRSRHCFLSDHATCYPLLEAVRAEAVRPQSCKCRTSADSSSIIRILVMIPIYAVVSFLSYLFYKKAVYFEVLRDCYEAFAIASFFTLMCHYIAPNLHEQKEYFRNVQPKNWVWPITWMQKCSGGEDKGWLRRPRSGLTWFNVRTHTNPASCHS